jgi:pilus assembly protein CpaB
MNKHAMIPLAIGLLVGIFALKMGYDYMNKLKHQGGTNFGPATQIVVANQNIPLGSKLTAKDVKLEMIPKKLAPEGACTDVKEVIGQSLKSSVSAKMPIMKEMIGPGEGLDGIIPVGYRAVAVKVDEFTGVGGLLRPGVKVDVLGTFSVKRGGRTERISKVVLQNVEVRAVGQEYRPENMENVSSKVKPSRSVTLMVKSEQAETLELAASSGTIRLALRSVSDDEPASQGKGITLSQMLRLNPSPENQDPSKSLSKLLSMFNPQTKADASAETNSSKKHDPYVVEVLTGSKMERIYFASASSDQRVEPKDSEKEESSKAQEPEKAKFAEVSE